MPAYHLGKESKPNDKPKTVSCHEQLVFWICIGAPNDYSKCILEEHLLRLSQTNIGVLRGTDSLEHALKEGFCPYVPWL